jgi:hypothetical protein
MEGDSSGRSQRVNKTNYELFDNFGGVAHFFSLGRKTKWFSLSQMFILNAESK